MSAALLTLTGFTSTPNDGATAWMAANWAVPDVKAASRRTEARVTPGAICLSSSSHFPLIPYSKLINPVALPPGRARFSMKPPPTGSATCTNTIGTSRVACSNGAKVEVPGARRTSGRSASNSAAYLRALSALPAPQRKSIVTLRPTVQPNCCRLCKKTALRAWACGSSASRFTSTPMRRTPPGCCARAASGQVAAAPPSNDMNARRLMGAPPQARAERYHTVAQERRCASQQKLRADVADGSKLGHPGNVRCTTALPPKAEVHPRCCYVAEVPRAAVSRCSNGVRRKPVYSITSSARNMIDGGICTPRAFAVAKLITNSNLLGWSTGSSDGLAPFKSLPTYPPAKR